MKSKASPASQHRCLYLFLDGRRCRMLRKSGHPSLCAFHAREEHQHLETEKLADEFASLSGKYVTALDVNHVLGKVFDAFAHKRINARTANTLAFGNTQPAAVILRLPDKGSRRTSTSTQSPRKRQAPHALTRAVILEATRQG